MYLHYLSINTLCLYLCYIFGTFIVLAGMRNKMMKISCLQTRTCVTTTILRLMGDPLWRHEIIYETLNIFLTHPLVCTKSPGAFFGGENYRGTCLKFRVKWRTYYLFQ